MRNTQRLDKILSNSGYGTRKEIKKLVKQGVVRVDGEVVKDSSIHVDPDASVIEIGGKELVYRKYIYIMMNKPAGVISATYDSQLPTVIDLLPDEYRHFNPFPAGRLDIDTEGFLLITNDGQLAHKILSPKKHIPKKYYALVIGEVTEADVDKFSRGVVLDDGYKTLPAELNVLRAGMCSEIELIIHEGKFHQVKRMFEAVGKKVKYLRRLEIGSLRLDEGLEPGEFRELTGEELESLKASVGDSE
ncbi:MAG TPA: rRNA pseudouridine synthase [Clostridiaceae bacterium]|nr:rRNA pseudouridine synthase [Clostridiaceae bacterium]